MSALPAFGRKNTPDRDDSYKVDKIPNTNGTVPFQRMIIAWSVVLVISALLGPIAWNQNLITRPPENTLDPSGLALWALMSMVIPHLVVYVLSVATTYLILPQSTAKYTGWLTRKSLSKLLIYYGLMETAILLFIVGGMLGLPENAYFQIVEDTGGMTQTASYLWNTSLFSMTIPAWVGYSCAWRCYRLIGAQTMQDRYESHLRITEIKNSGQWWDRITKIRIPALLGWDGNSPRLMILWFMLANLLLSFLFAPATVLEISPLYGIALFGAPTMLIAVFAAISKWRDGKITYRHPQYLMPVRGPETIDTYDPSKTGVRQFDRT